MCAARQLHPKCGATRVTSAAFYMPKLLEDAIGARFNVVSGYIAGSDIDLAVERGEVQCRAFTISTYFAREPFMTWRKKNFVRVLYQTGSKRDAWLKDVPTFNELMDKHNTSAPVRQLVKVINASDEFGRPIVAPPGVAPDSQRRHDRAAGDRREGEKPDWDVIGISSQ